MTTSTLIDKLKESVVDSIYEDERAHPRPPLLPPHALKQKISLEIDQANANFTEKLLSGFEVLRDYYETKKKEDPEAYPTGAISFLEPEGFSSIDEDACFQKLENDLKITDDISLGEILEIPIEPLGKAIHLAAEFIDRQRYEEASQALYFLANLAPDIAPIFSALGCAEYYLGKLEDAIAAYSCAFTLDPEDPQPLFHAAYCLNEAKKPHEAIEYLDQGLKIITGQEPESEGWRKAAEELRLHILKTV